MHTSTVLSAADFTYSYRPPNSFVEDAAQFSKLFPDYNPLDRVGVVSPRLEDGVLGVGVALLALTTAFYDEERRRGRAFFDYPYHFALLGGEGWDVFSHRGPIDHTTQVMEATWGNLDVWPETNWQLAAPNATVMLRKVYSLQINRLFWPETPITPPDEPQLPKHARALLQSRLKSVFLYDSASPNCTVRGSQRAQDMVASSVRRLPGSKELPALLAENAFRQVTPEEFLASVEASFAKGAS